MECDQNRRLLLIDSFWYGSGSGLEIALADLARQLEALGWQVDLASALAALPPAPARSWLSGLQRWRWLGAGQRVPGEWRRLLVALARSRASLQAAARQLDAVERLLCGPQPYERVLLCVDNQPPGMTALVTERAPGALLICLHQLAHELGDRWWPLMLALGRGAGHPYLFRRVDPCRIERAIFASAGWRDMAVAAGLPPALAQVIPFGLPLPPALPRPDPPGRRLLWVGRLSPEKGLHLLIAALPLIRAALPDVRLTVIAGDGPVAYRRAIMAQIRRSGLGDAVQLCPPVARAQLQGAYAAHDLLFFYSAHADPAALVLMEAFAAGLPMVASRAAPGAMLVRDGETCLCYAPADGAGLAEAVVRLLVDPDLRRRLSAQAQALVRADFTLGAMGAAYDRVLRRSVAPASACSPARPPAP